MASHHGQAPSASGARPLNIQAEFEPPASRSPGGNLSLRGRVGKETIGQRTCRSGDARHAADGNEPRTGQCAISIPSVYIAALPPAPCLVACFIERVTALAERRGAIRGPRYRRYEPQADRPMREMRTEDRSRCSRPSSALNPPIPAFPPLIEK